MLGSLELDSQRLTQLLNVNLSIARVPNHAHEGRLERLNLTSLGKQPLQIVIDAGFLDLQFFVFLLRSLELLVKLCDLPVGELKLLFSALDVLQDVVVRLVCPLNQPLVEFSLRFARLKLLFELLDLLQHTLSLLLLLLQAIGEQ